MALDVATDAMFPILADAKIPHVSQVSWGDKVKTDPNTHVIGTGNDAYIFAGFKTGADKGAKQAALFVEDSPAGRAAIDLWELDAQKFGIESTKTIIDPANADWLSAVSSGVRSETDMVSCVAERGRMRFHDEGASADRFQGHNRGGRLVHYHRCGGSQRHHRYVH